MQYVDLLYKWTTSKNKKKKKHTKPKSPNIPGVYQITCAYTHCLDPVEV